MRKSILVIMAATLPAVAVYAEPVTAPKSTATSGKLLPLKGTNAGNACAAYGTGFVKLEGSNTCVKIGGAISVGVGSTAGSR